MIKLITTDSYFNIFSVLLKELKNTDKISGTKNLIFCEDKVSLMTERVICTRLGGSFNTEVYSFGGFLRGKINGKKVLSKEGSAMAIKRILGGVNLTCFKASKTWLAPSLYELIVQLKSAKITPSDLSVASQSVSGILKNKITDVAAVYGEYENFIAERGFDDQSSLLSYLPENIENYGDIKNSNVYLLGFANGWTKQIRTAISTLLKCAKSVTAILVSGDNSSCYLNETADAFIKLVKEQKLEFTESRVCAGFVKEGEILRDYIFTPKIPAEKYKTDKVFMLAAKNKREEAVKIAEIIAQKVMCGECRYRNFSVAVPDALAYKDDIKYAFDLLGVPYFLDIKKKPDAHPLIVLIFSFIELFRNNMKRETLAEFFKNPLICEDKNFSDGFENYLIKYNVDYSAIKNPLKYQTEDGKPETLKEYENFRQKICAYIEKFDVKKLLEDVNAKEKLEEFSNKLKELGEKEEAALNDQVYSAVQNILGEMDLLLFDTKLSYVEYKNLFASGISALELSIIPQYSDAVFIGDYKEVALSQADYLFAIGLTCDVPQIKDDVALLTDGDISGLSEISLLIEPKIRVVNHRARESTFMGVTAFKKGLYLSYPVSGVDGSKKNKSEIITTVNNLFTVKSFPEHYGYYTIKQGLKSFALDCGNFAECLISDFTRAATYYGLSEKSLTDRLLSESNKQVTITLDRPENLYEGETSPTTIEDYYSCPYKAFLSRGLMIKPKEKGEVDGLSIGNIMHEVFQKYANKINEVCDEESSRIVVSKIKEDLLKEEKYKRYTETPSQNAAIERIFNECEKFCFRSYKAFAVSDFKEIQTEVSFGEGKKYNAIPLANGQIKLKGKIDRIDSCKDYYRILDYKTGSVDVTDKTLFSGNKLQLYLYAAAVQGLKLAGAYYIPVSDGYLKPEEEKPPIAVGKTLLNEEVIKLQDNTVFDNGYSDFLPIKVKGEKVSSAVEEETLSSYVKYALKVCEKAAEQMLSGVIVPSPYTGACEYCDYKAMCGAHRLNERSLKSVDKTVITQAVKEE